MSDPKEVLMPPCPKCRTPLSLNGIDDQRDPPIAVFACASCNVNFFAKVPKS